MISSRPISDTDEPDEGTFITLSNGDVEERGKILNPASGEVEDYVEVWRRFLQKQGAEYCVLERDDGGAFLGRIGVMALGIARGDGDGLLIWRDELVGEEWKRIFESGSSEEEMETKLPSLRDALPESSREGDLVQLGGRRWTIRVVGKL